MDSHQVSLAARGGATGGRPPGAAAGDQYAPSAPERPRAHPTAPELCRARAAHDKCHRGPALQPEGLTENRENSVKVHNPASCVSSA